MKVIQVNKADQGPLLVLADLKRPQPGLGESLRFRVPKSRRRWDVLVQ
jgi:hypothetical protein